VHLEFEYQFDDYVEANRSHRTVARRRSFVGPLAGWVLFIGLAVVLFMLLNSRAVSPGRLPVVPATRTSAPGLEFLLPVVPWLLIFGFIWFFVFRSARRSKPQSFLYASNDEAELARRAATKSNVVGRVVMLLVIVGAGCALLFVWFIRQERDANPGGGQVTDFLLPFVPWVLIFLFIWFFVFRALRGSRRMWEGQAHLRHEKSLDADEAGVAMVDGVSRSEYRWDAFQSVRETPNLFVLYLSDFSMMMVPKRAFDAPASIDEFRELLRRQVADRPAPAFPVVPLQS
jgi:preprotein translocase subunit YajC